MTTQVDTQEEQFTYFLDSIVEDVGKKIEGIYPYLSLLEKKTKDTPEYRLIDRIWVDWCDYLETDS